MTQQQQQLELTLEAQVDKTQATAVGVDAYVGGLVFERGTRRQVAVFGMIIQTINNVTNNNHGLNSGMLKFEIFALPGIQLGLPGTGGPTTAGGSGAGGGGAHQGRAPESITMHGAPNFRGPHAPGVNQQVLIEQATGSVSATSMGLAQFRDLSFLVTSTGANTFDVRIG